MGLGFVICIELCRGWLQWLMNSFSLFRNLHQLSFLDTRGLNLSSYNNWTIGPSWFTCSRFASISTIQLELDKIWSNFLCCQVSTGLSNSKNKSVELHNPSFVARQFRFSQAIPTPYLLDPIVRRLTRIFLWSRVFSCRKWGKKEPIFSFQFWE